MTNEDYTRTRDYKHEYNIRRKRIKRLIADMDREKVEAFQRLLNKREQTFINWLDKKIDEELKRAK